MAKKITEIEGIGPVMEGKLAQVGVTTVEGLLEKGASAAGRQEIADGSGIDAKKVMSFVNMADLYRVKGVGSEYAELLMIAGVDSPTELAKRVPENLHKKIMEVNEEKKLVRRPPTEKALADWIEFAKGLKPVVMH